MLMLTSWVLSKAKCANVDIMGAIKGKVCLLMLTACMLSKAKCAYVDIMGAIKGKVC